MIKEIKGENLVKDAPKIINENFKELEERIIELEKKLKII